MTSRTLGAVLALALCLSTEGRGVEIMVRPGASPQALSVLGEISQGCTWDLFSSFVKTHQDWPHSTEAGGRDERKVRDPEWRQSLPSRWAGNGGSSEQRKGL